MKRLQRFHFPPPFIALSLAVIVNLVVVFAPQIRIANVRSEPLAIVFFLISAALGGSAVLTFFKNNTTINPDAKPSALVTSGPYKFSRNPMYLGLLMLLVSYSFWRGMAVFFVAPIAFYLIMDKYVIPNEEKVVKEFAGGKYDLYKKSVRRWL